MTQWKQYRIDDICDLIAGFAFKSSDFGTDGFPVIKIKDIQPPFVNTENSDKVNLSSYDKDKLKKYLVSKGDFILAMTGATIGKVGIYTNEHQSYLNQRVLKFVPKKHCNREFIYYSLLANDFQKYIVNHIDSDSAQPNISANTIGKYVISMPSLKEQQQIASTLSFIDSKIKQNRQINDNLEAMAKQLYDYWFVQFDFPDENGKPYKSSGGKMVWNEKLKREIPIEWDILPLFDIANVQYGYPFATEQFTEKKTNIPVVRIRDILEGTTSAYSFENADEKYRLNEGDVVVGMDGNFHMNFWHDNAAFLNQRCVRMRPYEDSPISSIQILHSIKPYIKAKEQCAKGSTVGHLSDKDLKGLYLMQPLNTLTFNSRKVFDELLALIIENKKQILFLIKQRNELLPLLMNGQITIE